jgi:hypothetical protein
VAKISHLCDISGARFHEPSTTNEAGQAVSSTGDWHPGEGRNAGIAQLVERNLAKVEVASSSLVSRSIYKKGPLFEGPFFV